MGCLPSTDAALPVAGVLGGLTLLVWLVVLVRHEVPLFVAVTALLLMRGLLPAVIPPGFLFHELWAGLLVTLSIGLHGVGRRYSSVAAGVLALFIRELALPFVIIMLVLAWYEKHRRETLAWAFGLVTFGVYLMAHAVHVNGLLTAGDPAHEGWLQLNGWSFALATARFNTLLTAGPAWLVAVAVPASLLGLIGWRGPVAVRVALTVAGYLCAFAMVGRSCNCYWGMLYAPLLALGFVYAPWALLDLLQAVRGTPVSPPASEPVPEAAQSVYRSGRQSVGAPPGTPAAREPAGRSRTVLLG